MEEAPWRDVGVDGKRTELSGWTGFCKLKGMSCFHFWFYFSVLAAVTTRHRFQTILSCKSHSRVFAKIIYPMCRGWFIGTDSEENLGSPSERIISVVAWRKWGKPWTFWVTSFCADNRTRDLLNMNQEKEYLPSEGRLILIVIKYRFGPCCIAQAVSHPVSYRRCTGSVPGQAMWDLWRTNWHWDGFKPSSSVCPAYSRSTKFSTFIDDSIIALSVLNANSNQLKDKYKNISLDTGYSF
jgi:hypothetical protein